MWILMEGKNISDSIICVCLKKTLKRNLNFLNLHQVTSCFCTSSNDWNQENKKIWLLTEHLWQI